MNNNQLVVKKSLTNYNKSVILDNSSVEK